MKFLNYTFTATKSVFVFILFLSLSSCSNDKAKLANSLPENSALVLKLNSESLFSDSFMDVLSNMDLMKDFVTGDFKDVITDPSKAGIQRLSDFYVFVSGTDGTNLRIGGIVPLTDSDLFKAFLVKNKMTPTETDGVNSASKGNQYTIVWDKDKAVFYYSVFGGELLKEASVLLKQNEGTTLNKISTLSDLVKSESHITVWTNNENMMNLYNAASKMAAGFGAGEVAPVLTDMKNSYSLSFVDFKDGEIQTKVLQYLNDSQLKQQKLVTKTNSVASLLKVSGNEKPYAFLSLSMNTEGIFQTIKSYGALLSQVDAQLGGITTIEEISKMLSGDLYVALNGVTKEKKMVENSNFNFETGEYETTNEEIERVNPFITGSIGITDAKKLQEKIQPFVAAIPMENGIYNVNNEVYFCIKNNQFLIGSTLKSKAVIEKMNGKLNAAHQKIVSQQPTALYFDIDGTMGLFNDGKNQMAPFLTVLSAYFNDFITDGYSVKDNVIESKFSLTFKKQENSFVLLLKMIDELKKSTNTPEA